MGKEKTNGKDGAKKIGASAKDLGFKYGVTDLAEKLGIAEASARVQLRNKGIEKNGAVYGWNSRAELDEVIAKIKAGKSEEKKSSKKADKAEKTAKATKEPKAKKSAGRSKAPKGDEGDDAGEGAEA